MNVISYMMKRTIPIFINYRIVEMKTKDVENILNNMKTEKIYTLKKVTNTEKHLVSLIDNTREELSHVRDCVYNVKITK